MCVLGLIFDFADREVPQIGLPGGWLRITFVESLLVPVGIDGSFVTNGVQAGDFFRRQFPTKLSRNQRSSFENDTNDIERTPRLTPSV
jgi:hypothetical protein